MRDTSDVLTVSFDSGVKDESALCVSRKYNGNTIMLKMELGEQADILYHLLTEQMTKAEIKASCDDMGEVSDGCHTPKIGHWIKVHPVQADDEGAYMCSCCKVGDWDLKGTENFCPNCGARMAEEQERSEKE